MNQLSTECDVVNSIGYLIVQIYYNKHIKEKLKGVKKLWLPIVEDKWYISNILGPDTHNYVENCSLQAGALGQEPLVFLLSIMGILGLGKAMYYQLMEQSRRFFFLLV